MAFHDILLNPKFSYGAVGGPGFGTKVITMASGYEKRNINFANSYGRFDVAHSLLTQTDLDALIAFFQARNGRGHSFRFLDWTDRYITTENIGSFDGSPNDTLQIQKTYTDDGSNTQTKTITKPVDTGDTNHTLSITTPNYTTMTVTIGGASKTEGVDYSVNYSTGVITDLIGVAGACVVSCSFHLHARFDTDEMGISIDFYNRHSWQQIPIIELREVGA